MLRGPGRAAPGRPTEVRGARTVSQDGDTVTDREPRHLPSPSPSRSSKACLPCVRPQRVGRTARGNRCEEQCERNRKSPAWNSKG